MTWLVKLGSAFFSYPEEWRGRWRRWGSRASVQPRRCTPWPNRNATSSSPGGLRPPRRSPLTRSDGLQRDRKAGGQQTQTFSDSARASFYGANRQNRLTVIVQLCGARDQHEEEERCKAESHAKQLCMTETEAQRRRVRSDITTQTTAGGCLWSHMLQNGHAVSRPLTPSLSHLSDAVADHSHGFSLEQIHFCVTWEAGHHRTHQAADVHSAGRWKLHRHPQLFVLQWERLGVVNVIHANLFCWPWSELRPGK